jgi:hypothetical protein
MGKKFNFRSNKIKLSLIEARFKAANKLKKYFCSLFGPDCIMQCFRDFGKLAFAFFCLTFLFSLNIQRKKFPSGAQVLPS